MHIKFHIKYHNIQMVVLKISISTRYWYLPYHVHPYHGRTTHLKLWVDKMVITTDQGLNLVSCSSLFSYILLGIPQPQLHTDLNFSLSQSEISHNMDGNSDGVERDESIRKLLVVGGVERFHSLLFFQIKPEKIKDQIFPTPPIPMTSTNFSLSSFVISLQNSFYLFLIYYLIV